MGAYENPQMIIPPDYGEIFRRNFEAGKAQVEAAYQRAEARREKIKAEQQRLDDKILAFDLQRMDIKAGDLTQSLQQQTTFLADDYAENERLYSEGKISREKYNSNRISSFRKLNEMKGLAGILTQQSKELQDVDLSDYQGGAVNGIGLMEAWKKGEIKFQYVGDEIEMYYKKGDDLIAVDTQSLQEGEFFNINEKYAVSSEELKNIAGGKIIQPAHRQGQTFIGKDGKQYTRQQDQYADGVTNEEFAEDQINSYISNSKMQKLFNNNKDAGSIYMDTVFKTMVMQDAEGNSVLTTEGKRLLNKTFVNSSEEEKEIIKQQIISGQYDKTNKANLDQISKRYVAEQSWNQVKGNLKSAESVSQPKGSGNGDSGTQNEYFKVLSASSSSISKLFDRKENSIEIDPASYIETSTEKGTRAEVKQFKKSFIDSISGIKGLEKIDEFDDGTISFEATPQFQQKYDTGKKIEISPNDTPEEIQSKLLFALGATKELADMFYGKINTERLKEIEKEMRPAVYFDPLSNNIIRAK